MRQMWRCFARCSVAGHTHLEKWGWLMHSGDWGDKYTSEQASAFLIHSYVASYLQVGNVQGVSQFSVDSWGALL